MRDFSNSPMGRSGGRGRRETRKDEARFAKERIVGAFCGEGYRLIRQSRSVRSSKMGDGIGFRQQSDPAVRNVGRTHEQDGVVESL